MRSEIRLWAASVLTLALLAAAVPSRAEVPNTVTITAGSRQGLGLVVEAEGFVLTTFENLRDPTSGRLLGDLRAHVWEEDRSFDAAIIGVEPTLNLAVLKLETKAPLRASRIQRELDLEIGREILVATRLYDSDFGTAKGRLSGLNSKECYQESLTGTMFRTPLEIPAAVAGAPVYTSDGEVVALYTAHHADEDEVLDETFLLPAFIAVNVYESIKNKGSLLSPWTGFSVRPLTEAEQRLFPIPTGHRSGVGIEHIWKGSPAERMDIREGDFLIQISHNRVGSVADFQKWLYLYGVGQPVKLVFLRGGTQLLATDYVIEERPAWAEPR